MRGERKRESPPPVQYLQLEYTCNANGWLFINATTVELWPDCIKSSVGVIWPDRSWGCMPRYVTYNTLSFQLTIIIYVIFHIVRLYYNKRYELRRVRFILNVCLGGEILIFFRYFFTSY